MRGSVPSRSLRTLAVIALALGTAGKSAAEEVTGSTLTVCADPANLPYSNEAEEGFENRIAKILAADLGLNLRYFWFAEHKNFLRNSLNAGLCDAVLSVPAALSNVAATRPYFTSTYVAVTRADDERRFSSFDDPWLKDARIGLQLVGNEGITTPPAAAVARRGLTEHITAFPMWAEDGETNPQGDIVEAVADGRIDIAFVWGPFAGYFGKRHGARLAITPIMADPQSPELVFVYPMSIGVRKNDAALGDKLQKALDRNVEKIGAVLRDAGVPLVEAPAAPVANAAAVAPKAQ